MAVKKTEKPVEGEIIEEINIETSQHTGCCNGKKSSGPGVFFGLLFLIWGGVILQIPTWV